MVAQEVTLGGKGSVTYPSLNVGPGETFQVRIDMQLMRPSNITGGPLVQVDLDGVLFQDLSFFGPDRLNSRRTMTACEMEAQRDREHFKRILAQTGKAGLQREMLESMARQSEVSQLAVTVKRTGRAVSSAATGPEHDAEFAFLKFPDSPVEPHERLRTDLRQRSAHAAYRGAQQEQPARKVCGDGLDCERPVRQAIHGWVAAFGRFGPVLAPGRSARLLQETTLNFSAKGQPVNVSKMVGFVNQVEFADGKIWVPNRQNLENAMLLKVLPPSAEEQRLTDIYRKYGPEALVAELSKF